MEGLAALGGGVLVLASLVVGLRLIALARRTRGLPELVMGLGLFLMGGVSYPLTVVAFQAESLGIPARSALVAAYMVLNGLGMTALAYFTRRVFRPRAPWAAAAVAAVAGGYAASLLAQVAGPGLADLVRTQQGPWNASLFVAAATPLWAGGESLLYHLKLRKRLALGLAEPVVVDRFRLWCVAMWCASVMTAASIAIQALGVSMVSSALGGLVLGPLALVMGSCLWLAFFPPEAYLRRVRRAAGTSAAPA